MLNTSTIPATIVPTANISMPFSTDKVAAALAAVQRLNQIKSSLLGTQIEFLQRRKGERNTILASAGRMRDAALADATAIADQAYAEALTTYETVMIAAVADYDPLVANAAAQRATLAQPVTLARIRRAEERGQLDQAEVELGRMLDEAIEGADAARLLAANTSGTEADAADAAADEAISACRQALEEIRAQLAAFDEMAAELFRQEESLDQEAAEAEALAVGVASSKLAAIEAGALAERQAAEGKANSARAGLAAEAHSVYREWEVWVAEEEIADALDYPIAAAELKRREDADQAKALALATQRQARAAEQQARQVATAKVEAMKDAKTLVVADPSLWHKTYIAVIGDNRVDVFIPHKGRWSAAFAWAATAVPDTDGKKWVGGFTATAPLAGVYMFDTLKTMGRDRVFGHR